MEEIKDDFNAILGIWGSAYLYQRNQSQEIDISIEVVEKPCYRG